MAKSKRTAKALRVQHGVIASFPSDFFGYFGWLTVTLMPPGRLVVVASGLRNDSSCPFGRTVLCHSDEGGQKWTNPRVVNDSPLDDREAGIASLGKNQLLLSWFRLRSQRLHRRGPVAAGRRRAKRALECGLCADGLRSCGRLRRGLNVPERGWWSALGTIAAAHVHRAPWSDISTNQ